MKILITGASGYVGNSLVEDLKGNHEIIATARDISRIVVDGVQKAELDLLSPEQAHEIIDKIQPDAIVHAAALPKRSTADEEEFINTNVEGIRNIAEAVKNYSKAKFIAISSGCAFKQSDGNVIVFDSEREMGAAFSRSKNLAEKTIAGVFEKEEKRLAIIYPPVILHGSQQQGIIPYALHDAQTNGIITNKVPDGHVNFISHSKFAELIDAVAQDHSSVSIQRYLITGNRFTTAEFFKKMQTIFQNDFQIPCSIKMEQDPHFETMCAMDETAIQQLKPGFVWGSIENDIHAIIVQNLKKELMKEALSNQRPYQRANGENWVNACFLKII